MPSEERIKRGKFTFKVFQLAHGGPWYAGAEASKGSTREAAIKAHMAYARKSEKEATARYAKQKPSTGHSPSPDRRGEFCTHTGCGKRTKLTKGTGGKSQHWVHGTPRKASWE